VKNCYARFSRDGTRKQYLSEHLNEVAGLSAEFSCYKNISKLVGVLHDLGKATADFQKYLNDDRKRGSVVHAMQGAFIIDDMMHDSSDNAGVLAKEIASLVIASHHGSLSDGISPDGATVFFNKFAEKGSEKYSYNDVKQNATDLFPSLEYDISSLQILATQDTRSILCLIDNTYCDCESKYFALGLFIKYIYSCLIDADRLSALSFDMNEKRVLEIWKPKIIDWNSLIDTFENGIQQTYKESVLRFGSESGIVRIRQDVSNRCKEACTKKTGIYKLSVPTGGGKTLSSLRFALHHCKEKKKKRIIYVIPYLSIIDQTALEFRKVMNLPKTNEIILEHHSNLIPPDDENESTRQIRELATSRWDKPIIITTMVQFLETVMSAKGGDLRKFHNMADSVIIFDEIQSLPIKTINLFNEVVSFLAKLCDDTILLCTATQPQLEKTERENLLLERGMRTKTWT